MRNLKKIILGLTLLLSVFQPTFSQGNLVVRQIFAGGVAIKYTGNLGLAAANPNPNTDWNGTVFTTYNFLATRGSQGNLFSNSNGMTMSPDGTHIYSVNWNGGSEGFTSDSVTQYNLSTAWDLTTMSAQVGHSPSLNAFPSYNEQNPVAAFFSPDGMNMYVSGGLNRIYRYTLGTAYTVSTATAHSSFATGLTAIEGISFSQDGTKMFVVGSGAFIRRFTLSSAWDITTASNDSMSLAISGGNSVFFKDDGTAFFTYDGSIKKYLLATAWDLSSYIAVQTSVLLNNLTYVYSGGIYISPNGLNYYQSNYVGAPVKRFELKTPFKIK